MIDGLTNSDAIPVLERLMQFAGQRHRIITNNIANLSTPGFRPADVSVQGFQHQLGEAIDARRANRASGDGPLHVKSTSQIEISSDSMILHPEPQSANVLFHDENDRDVERIMQGLVENFTAYRTAAQFLRSRFELLNSAIRERV